MAFIATTSYLATDTSYLAIVTSYLAIITSLAITTSLAAITTYLVIITSTLIVDSPSGYFITAFDNLGSTMLRLTRDNLVVCYSTLELIDYMI